MLNTINKGQTPSDEYNDIVDYWLSLRQKVLIDYGKVAGLLPLNQPPCLPTQEEFNRFCQTLVDYISAGHFKIYEMIMDRWKATGFSTNQDIDALYFKIVETTTPLVNFNDKYAQCVIEETDFLALDKDISTVGEIMEIRFKNEDELITLIKASLSIPPGA